MRKILIAAALLASAASPALSGAAEPTLPTLAACNWVYENLKDSDAAEVRSCLKALVVELQFNRGERARLERWVERLKWLADAPYCVD